MLKKIGATQEILKVIKMFIKRTFVYMEQGKQLMLKVIKMFIKRTFAYMEQGKQLMLKVI